MSRVEFSGKLDEPLLRRAIAMQTTGGKTTGIVMIVAGLGGMLTMNDSAGIAAIGLFLFGVILLATPWIYARRAIRTNALMSSQLRGFADDERFGIANEFSQSEIPWSKLYQVRIKPDLVLLSIMANQSYVLPRRFFASDEDWTTFCTLARAHVPASRGLFPMVKTILFWMVLTVGVFLVWSLVRTG